MYMMGGITSITNIRNTNGEEEVVGGGGGNDEDNARRMHKKKIKMRNNLNKNIFHSICRQQNN